jgi:hypothetical protein
MVTGIAQTERGPGGECLQCPMAQWRTAKDGAGNAARGQACKEVRYLLMALPDGSFPEVIRATPGSLGNIKSYMLRLAREKRAFWSVFTKLVLVEDKNEGGSNAGR